MWAQSSLLSGPCWAIPPDIARASRFLCFSARRPPPPVTWSFRPAWAPPLLPPKLLSLCVPPPRQSCCKTTRTWAAAEAVTQTYAPAARHLGPSTAPSLFRCTDVYVGVCRHLTRCARNGTRPQLPGAPALARVSACVHGLCARPALQHFLGLYFRFCIGLTTCFLVALSAPKLALVHSRPPCGLSARC